MPSRTRAFLAAAFAAVFLVMLSPSASASVGSYNFPAAETYIDTSQSLDVSFTFTPTQDSDYVRPRVMVDGGNPYNWIEHIVDEEYVAGSTYTFHHTIPADVLASSCGDGNGRLSIYMEFLARVESIPAETRSYPCGFGPQLIPVAVVAPTWEAVCGGPDVVTLYDQPAGVLLSYDTGQLPTGRDIGYVADAGYVITNQADYSFPDDGAPCVIDESLILDPIHNEICGYLANDTFTMSTPVPEGMNPELAVSWNAYTATVTYHALDGWEFANGASSKSFEFTDERHLCEAPDTTLTLNVDTTQFQNMDPDGEVTFSASHDHQSGDGHRFANFTLTLDGDTGPGHNSGSRHDTGYSATWVFSTSLLQEACADGVIDLQVASSMMFWEEETTTKTESINGIACSYASGNTVISPVLTAPTIVTVCGEENDTVTPATSQPEGVIVEPTITEYNLAGIYTLTYAAADGFEFAEGYDNTITHTDTGEPCTAPEAQLHVGLDPDDLIAMDPDAQILFYPSITHQTEAVHTTVFFSLWMDDDLINVSGNVELLSNGFGGEFYLLPSDLETACEDGYVDIQFEGEMVYEDHPASIETITMNDVPCSFASIITEPLLPPTIVEFCGANNDVVNHSMSQPEGVSWVPQRTDYDANNVYTLTYSSQDGYEFAEGYENTITHTDPEPAEPCSLVTPTGELNVIEVCGYTDPQSNDIITLVPQEGVEVTRARWLNSLYRITVQPAPGYAFPDGISEDFDRSDSNTICSEPEIDLLDDSGELVDIVPGATALIPATLTLPEGNPFDYANLKMTSDFATSESDTVFIPELGDGGEKAISFPFVTRADFYETCAAANGEIEIMVTVELTGPRGVERTLTDSGVFACDPLQPITPNASLLTRNAVCGDNNDTVSTSQEGVNVTLGDWSDNTATATFSPAEGYTFTVDAPTTVDITDEGPCLVEFVEPSAPEAVCGPDNDVYSAPDQPDGVVVDDSGWSNNQRTIIISPAEGYVFASGENFVVTYTDEALECEVDPVGKQVTVNLNTSDGGSIEGTSYQLYAPMASQVAAAPYAEGQVGPNNQIVFQDLVAGDYRLVVNAEGYEPVDAVLEITESDDPQEITLQVAAVQAEVTPTPDPTETPTQTETPAPTATEPAKVSGLPETGTGDAGSGAILAIAGLLVAVIVTGIGSLRISRK